MLHGAYHTSVTSFDGALLLRSRQVFHANTVPAECNDLVLRKKDSITKYTGPARVFRCGGALCPSCLPPLPLRSSLSPHPVCLVALSFFPPAVWATRGPVIVLYDKRV